MYERVCISYGPLLINLLFSCFLIMNRFGMFRNCIIIFYISSQVTSGFSLSSVTTDSKESSTTPAVFNCKDTQVNLHYSSLVSGTGLEVSSPGECRARCRGEEGGEGCSAWSWFPQHSDSRSLRCFTGREAGASVAGSRAVSGAQNCRFSSL